MSLFCTNYDIVIVGGGISGLFVAYKLCETNLNILLIEKSSSLGGRIHTIYNKKMIFNMNVVQQDLMKIIINYYL